jgi:hypothetical protein
MVALFFCVYLFFEFTGNYLESTLLTVIFFLSPIINYYTPNFLPDVLSLLFTIGGWYFFFRFRRSTRLVYIVFATVFLSLGALLKITSLISTIVIAAVFLIDQVRIRKLRYTSWFTRKKYILIAIVTVALLVSAWYSYARFLNEKYYATWFLLQTKPVQSWEHFVEVGRDFWGPWYYSSWMYLFLLAGTIFILFRYRFTNKLVMLITAGLYTGAIFFILLMWSHIKDYDYYTIPLFIAVFFHLLLISTTIRRQPRFIPKLVYWLIILILPFQMLSYSSKYQVWVYDKYLNNPEINFLSQYDGLENYIRSIGVKKSDVTVSLYDYSPNITLYFMNQRGWSLNTDHDEERINHAFRSSKILVASDTLVLLNHPFTQFSLVKLCEFKGLGIYDIKGYKDEISPSP